MRKYSWPQNIQESTNDHTLCGETAQRETQANIAEKLIREGYLRKYVHNGGAQPHEDRREAEPPRVIRTIFSKPYFAREMRVAQNRYLREAREGPVPTVSSPDQQLAKQFRSEADLITFSENDTHHVRHPHCDALVIRPWWPTTTCAGFLSITGVP